MWILLRYTYFLIIALATLTKSVKLTVPKLIEFDKNGLRTEFQSIFSTSLTVKLCMGVCVN